MKILLGELKNSENALLELMGNKLLISLNYKLDRLFKEMNNEFKNLEDSRVKLIQKYADEDGLQVKKENEEKFNIEFNELLNTEISLNHEPFEIKLSSDIKLTTFNQILLEKLIKFVE